MELKYYLRGLGLGIVVTAIIMGIASSGKQTMTDEEIIARAKQLGMTEARVLTETVAGEKDTPDIEQTPDTAPAAPISKIEENSNDDDGRVEDTDIDEGRENNQENENSDDGVENLPEAVDTESDELPDGHEEEQAAQTAAEPSGDRPMAITIGNGDGSYQVSLKLFDIGAISSATDYDNFLCENGYDKRIRSGTHTIPAGASNEQIARIITGAE